MRNCSVSLRRKKGRDLELGRIEKTRGNKGKIVRACAHYTSTKATMAEEESARQFRAASLSFTVTITLAPPPVPRPFDRLGTREKQCERISFEREWIKSISFNFLVR